MNEMSWEPEHVKTVVTLPQKEETKKLKESLQQLQVLHQELVNERLEREKLFERILTVESQLVSLDQNLQRLSEMNTGEFTSPVVRWTSEQFRGKFVGIAKTARNAEIWQVLKNYLMSLHNTVADTSLIVSNTSLTKYYLVRPSRSKLYELCVSNFSGNEQNMIWVTKTTRGFVFVGQLGNVSEIEKKALLC